MPKKLITVGLEMPQDFPTDPYNAVHDSINSWPNRPDVPWLEYALAWNAVAYRFQALADHCDTFTASVNRAGGAPSMSERYVQERELFNFFSNGLAAIESFFYGLYAIASMLDPAKFPM